MTRTYGCLSSNGDLGHLADTFSTEVVTVRALNHESLKRKPVRRKHAIFSSEKSYLFIVPKAATTFGVPFSTRHKDSSMINAGSVSLVHCEGYNVSESDVVLGA